MIRYNIEIIIFQGIFIILYELLLKKETFFTCNRIYLFTTYILSLLLPLIEIDFFKRYFSSSHFEMFSEEFVTTIPKEGLRLHTDGVMGVNANMTLFEYVFYVGVIVACMVFILKIWGLIQLILKNPKEKTKAFTLVKISNENVAFSFFRYVFIGDCYTGKDRESVIAHENKHIEGWHSLDLIFFELQRMLFWFNPLVYLYQNYMSLVHEFIVDAQIVNNTPSKKHYYKMLIAQAFSTNMRSLINSFSTPSLIKKRIIMLGKSKSDPKQLFKYLVMLPVVALMLCYSACSLDQTIEENITSTIPKIQQTTKNTDVATAIQRTNPIFPGCETSKNEKRCLSAKVQKMILNNFDTSLLSVLEGKTHQRLHVAFKIAEDGMVTAIKVRAPHPDLEEEAIRVMKLCPRLAPAKIDDKSVAVSFYMPVVLTAKKT